VSRFAGEVERALTWFAEDDHTLRAELVPVLREGVTNERESMAARSRKLLTP
jgi:hypothetical protein